MSIIFPNKPANGSPEQQQGGPGDDIFFVDHADDIIIEAANQGRDVVYATVNYALNAGSHVEVLSAASLSGTDPLQLSGNELDQEIYGNAGANVLRGGGGVDFLLGGLGDDTYYITDGRETIFEYAGEGRDIIYTSLSHGLAAGSHVEVLSAISLSSTDPLQLSGNELNQEIYGNAGANILRGGGGFDLLLGGFGDDEYYITSGGETIFEYAGQGRDIIYTGLSHGLAAGSHVEVLSAISLSSTDPLQLSGNELDNEIYGNAGANVLRGGGGTDFLLGGLGDDEYYITSGGETIFEYAGQGRDIIYTSLSYTLAAGSHVEILSAISLTSTDALNFGGNELDNYIFGNAGANILYGGGGVDNLSGGGGDDTYYILGGGEILAEAGGGGNDTAYASVSYTLTAGAQVEILSAVSLGGTDALGFAGNEFANQLYGNAGANSLDGRSGNDYLVGGGGADLFTFTTSPGAGNVDIVADFQVGIDKIRLGGDPTQPFAALASGALAAGAFVIGPAALQADDVLIYDSGTGALFYDADGSGAQAAIQFATLAPGLGLTAADFIVSGPLNTPPAITSPTTANVVENSPASAIVYQTVASDADGDRITYSLGGADAGLLTIDAVTGAVRLIAPADYETRTQYSFSVIASDSGPTAAVHQVTLNVIDVSDTSTPIINDTGPNDSIGAAQNIARATLAVATNPNLPDDDLPSATIVGSIGEFDRDFFSITLAEGELLMLDVDGTNGLDSHVRVYNSAGTEVGDNDDMVSFDPGSTPPFGHNTDSFIRFRAPTAGTYYFSIESFQDQPDPTEGDYQLHVSVGPPATMAQIISEDVDALVSGAQWPTTSLTYAFPTLPSQYPADIDETDSPSDNFEPFNATQQAAVIQQLQMISRVSALTFQLAANPSTANLRYAMSDQAEVAYAYYPGPAGGLAGTAWFNNSGMDFDNPVRGNYAWMGILHETGHALGLKHGHEFPAISFNRDSLEYTVMTYRSYPSDPITGGYSNETWGYPQSLMMYDIAALQRIYGANFNFNFSDTIYSWSQTTGELSVNFSGQGAPGGNRIFMTIWDGGGTDTYDFQSYTVAVTIDLRPGEWSTASPGQLADLGDLNFARGNIANALLFNDDPRSLIENARGGMGGDTLIANQAANNLMGWQGADTYKWMASTDAGTGSLADTINGLTHGADRIDLSNIDANPGTAGNDAFSFIDTGAFTSTAGQLRYQVEGSNVRIQADLDGNGVADMEIIVTDTTVLTTADFFL